MPFTKDSYKNAKWRADNRLTGWITDVKSGRDTGIPKLQKEYRHVFKKIEHVPKDRQTKNLYGSSESYIAAELYEKDFSESLFGFGNDISTVVVDDVVHDSNSSNLSSRLDNERDEIKISESRTPFNKTPLLLNEKENQSLDIRENKTKSVLDDFLTRTSGRRRNPFQTTAIPGLLSFQKRRRTRRSTKAHVSEQATIDIPQTQVFDDTLEEENLSEVPSVIRKTSSIMSSASTIRRGGSIMSVNNSQKPKCFKLLTTKGHVDLMLKRATRQYRMGRHMNSKHELPVLKAELTSEEHRNEVLNKFRKIVRLLIHIRVLLNVSRIRIEEEEKSKGFKRYDGGLELSFDASAFKSALSYSGLTVRARKSLKKNPEDRTDEDARILMEVLLRLPMFIKYPVSVKQALVKMMWYDMFNDGRVIVKQGDPGTRMYFVISGEADLKRTDKLDNGEVNSYHIKTVSAGATFGELALIRNMRREFTAVCRGTSEFLSLSKEEFNTALRSRWERDCNIRFSFLRSCEHFTNWTDKQLQACADSSELREYANNNVIIGDIDGPTDSVYFIRKGRCEVVRRIIVVRHQSPYQRPNILLPLMAKNRSNFLNKSYGRNRRLKQEESRYLTVTTLHPGNYFGVGENLRDTFIISKGKTELLVINAAQFSIQGKSEQLRRLTVDRDFVLPSNTAVYQKFQENRKWFEYRNQLLQDIVNRRQKDCRMTMYDVPRSILCEPTIPRDLIFYKN
ncbi:Cyclic nucleotide-binding domain-containing protein 2 [Mactra antiquata]